MVSLEQREKLRAALIAALHDDAAKISDAHLDNLIEKGYTDEGDLKYATRQGLVSPPPLPPAVIDKLLQVFGTQGSYERVDVNFFPTFINNLLQPMYRLAFRTQGSSLVTRLQVQLNRLEEQGNHLKEQGKRLKEQGNRLKEQGNRLKEQGNRLKEQGNRLKERASFPLLSPAARDRVEAASCVLLDEKTPIGTAFFVSAQVAMTCDHNLADLPVGSRIGALQPGGRVFFLTILQRSKELDCAALRCQRVHAYVPLYLGSAAKIVGKEIALCAFQISLRKELGDDFPLAMSIMRGSVMRISRRGRHFVYECNCWPGDSRACLALYDGEVLGMHHKGVNAIKELMEQKRMLNERLTEIEESVASAAGSVRQGAVGLLATAFPQI